jgi:hypothetical protein
VAGMSLRLNFGKPRVPRRCSFSNEGSTVEAIVEIYDKWISVGGCV